MTVPQLSSRLLLLLYATKHHSRSGVDFGPDLVRHALGDEYHPNLGLVDCLRHVIAAIEEVRSIPLFESHINMTALITAPSAGAFSLADWPTAEMECQIGQVYTAIIQACLSKIMLTRIDWCEQYQQLCKDRNVDRP